MVIVDKLSKYAHILPLSHPFTVLQVAQLYFAQIYKLHGLPKAIISDMDKIFTSTLWQTLFKLPDTALLMSSAYHPQTDGQTERLNQCLESFLHYLVSSCPRKWKDYLPLAGFWYNTTLHSALGRSPFEVLYGHPPRMLGITPETACDVPFLDTWLKDRASLTQVIQMQLLRAQHRMKQQADKNRSEREFNVGDLVYLKLQPYVQASVAPRSNQKLSFRFYGPFKILARVGTVAYKLDLPASCKIHPVIHVSQLKLHVPASVQVSSELPDQTDSVMLLYPLEVLRRTLVPHGGATAALALIRWTSSADYFATWEDEADVRRRFPDAMACGQAVSYGGRNVRTP